MGHQQAELIEGFALCGKLLQDIFENFHQWRVVIRQLNRLKKLLGKAQLFSHGANSLAVGQIGISNLNHLRNGRLERVTGIGPAYSAWEADVLPLNYTRTCVIERSNTVFRLKFKFNKKFTKVL